MRGAESRKSNLLGHLSAEPPTKATETLRCTGATVPVPIDEFDVMEPPPDNHELAWACRVLPTEGEKMLDKLSDEQAAVVRAYAARVPWMRKAAKAAKTRYMTQTGLVKVAYAVMQLALKSVALLYPKFPTLSGRIHWVFRGILFGGKASTCSIRS